MSIGVTSALPMRLPELELPELVLPAHCFGSASVEGEGEGEGVSVTASTGGPAAMGVVAGADGLRIFLKKLNMSGLWSQGIL